jgi:hypothetical protein
MSTLVDYLASNRIRGGRLVLAYAVGAILGIAVAVLALLVTGTA